MLLVSKVALQIGTLLLTSTLSPPLSWMGQTSCNVAWFIHRHPVPRLDGVTAAQQTRGLSMLSTTQCAVQCRATIRRRIPSLCAKNTPTHPPTHTRNQYNAYEAEATLSSLRLHATVSLLLCLHDDDDDKKDSRDCVALQPNPTKLRQGWFRTWRVCGVVLALASSV
jgi:hypothetical protein